MKCPSCGKTVSFRKNQCDSCKQDLTVYRQLISASNLHYNDALEKAKVRNLSAAIISLKKSLKFNKRNTDARNLLGLVYYELGEIVSALAEWVISKNFQEENNAADNYMDLLQSNQNKLASINQTIKKYNRALKSAKQGRREHALQQLAEVVEENPNFVRAHQLLALIHMERAEHAEAKKLLEQAFKIDKSDTKTLKYMDELPASIRRKDKERTSVLKRDYNTDMVMDEVALTEHLRKESERINAEVEPIKREPVRVNTERSYLQQEYVRHESERPRFEPETDVPSTSFNPNAYKEEHFNFWPYVTLILGALIGIAVVYFLVVPTATKKVATGYEESFKDFSDQLSAKNLAITTLENNNTDLEQQVTELEDAIKALQIAENEDGRDALLQALDSYFENDYNTAEELLKNALEYEETNELAMYYLGRVYHSREDNKKAKKQYKKFIEKYPDSEKAAEAERKLESIEEAEAAEDEESEDENE